MNPPIGIERDSAYDSMDANDMAIYSGKVNQAVEEDIKASLGKVQMALDEEVEAFKERIHDAPLNDLQRKVTIEHFVNGLLDDLKGFNK